MDQIRAALECESAAVTGAGVRVAVIDTGLDSQHPDFGESIDASAACAAAGFGDPFLDKDGHGTHIAGIIAGDGIACGGRWRGVATGVELIPIKATSWKGLDHDVAWAVKAAVERGAHIINFSGALAHPPWPPPWKWSSSLSSVDAMFKWAADQGVLCVIAAGNHGPSKGSVLRPGLNPDCLCVGATNKKFEVWSRSGRGPVLIDSTLRKGGVRSDDQISPSQLWKPDVVAPGAEEAESGTPNPVAPRSSHCGLQSSDDDDNYTAMGGTSQATAVVTGLAALAMELGNTLGLQWGSNRGDLLKRILFRAAQPVSPGGRDDFGHGGLYWPNIAALIEDCVRNPNVRSGIAGPVLRLL
jgi:subtilisin family serine protease